MKTRITGKVIDSLTKQPFEEPVNIKNLNTSFGVTTRVDGSFVIEASPNDILRFSFVEYQVLDIKASELPSVIVLKPDDMLNEVVITVGTKKEAKKYNYLGFALIGGLLIYAVAKDKKKKSKKEANAST
ncbi:carboxypeptidase-like regulatory domain-containing protein [Tenacibaculum sp. TC6]